MTHELIGQPVQIDPASPWWGRGARWGEVLTVAKGSKRKPPQALVSVHSLGRVWLPLVDLIEA
jgi:hypothetical protein